MRFCYISLLMLFTGLCLAQSHCTLSISGRVIDEHDKTPLAFAEVFIPELNRGTVVDSNGYFALHNLCAGNYTIFAKHIGCEPVNKELKLNTSLEGITLFLEHHTTLLQEAKIELPTLVNPVKITDAPTTLNKLNLPELRIQQTGENVFKPIVRGLSGNRVSTYVGSVELQDQQWGTDHGLSLQLYPDNEVYSGTTDGSSSFKSLEVLPNNVFNEKTILFSQLFYNGLGGQLGALHNQKINKHFGIGGRFQLNRSGDKSAPNYVLTNTSSAQANAQLDAAYKKNDWYVQFNTSFDFKDLATLRASHVGNVNDFKNAIEAKEPIVQKPFSYAINNPRQRVGHFIASAKATNTYTIKNQQDEPVKHGEKVFYYNYQLNNRQEFEARRGGNSNLPALNLQLQTHQFGASYTRDKEPGYLFEERYKVGFDQSMAINTNLPGPSFEPILPNYNSYITKVYGSFSPFLNGLETREHYLIFSGSLTYNYTLAQFFEGPELAQEVFNFITSSAKITYHNSSLGTYLSSGKKNNFITELTLNQRAPAPNELLISGVHHGTATIEEGSLNLLPETNFGFGESFKYQSQKYNTEIVLNAYANFIKNYIYQIPLAQPRLTIRGAFPVFEFTQSDAFLSGIELSGVKRFATNFTYTVGLNYIYAQDVENNTPIPLIPPFEWRNQIRFEKDVSATWQDFFVQVEHIYTGRQFRFNSSLDLTAPPPDYSLLNAAIGISRTKKHTYTFSLKAENLTNQTYRNYLDRFRYFADAAGINFLIECLINF